MTYEKSAKSANFFECIICDFNTCKKCDFNRHLNTLKHKNNEILINNSPERANKIFACDCGKVYKHNQSLYNHKKRCMVKFNDAKEEEQANPVVVNNNIDQTMIMRLISENNDIKNLLLMQQQQLLEQQKQLGEQQRQLVEIVPKICNVTNNTAHIKQNFNINVFLNEQCKNAINMNDFIKQIKLTLEDLDLTKNKGLEIGLSNAIIQSINKMSLFERPLHCTDTKRETLYIKDNDSWEKDSSKTKIKGALHNLNKAHFKLIQDWIAQNPDFKENDAKQDYFAYLLKTCSVNLKTIDDKIIKKICASNNLKTNLKEFENINYD
jgi:flagellar motor switch/type III secretory pathway protein FliN